MFPILKYCECVYAYLNMITESLKYPALQKLEEMVFHRNVKENTHFRLFLPCTVKLLNVLVN